MKRRRIVAAVAKEVVNNAEDDDDSVMNVLCETIQDYQQKERALSDSTSAALQVFGRTIRTTLMEINEVRERNRDRRHNELMSLLRKLCRSSEDAVTNAVQQTETQPQDELIGAQHEYIAEVIYKEMSNNCPAYDIKNECTSSLPNVDVNSAIGSNAGAIVSTGPDITGMKTFNINSMDVSTRQALGNKAPSTPHTKRDPNQDILLRRAKMLEMQRQKMEDRQRKKRASMMEQ